MNSNLEVGNRFRVEKKFNIEDARAFGKLSGDSNPIHFDELVALEYGFKKPIVQGILAASLFGGIFGSFFPGKGSIYLGQSLKFIKPNFVGEKVIAEVEIIDIRRDKPIYTFKTTCFNKENEVTIEGEAVILYKYV